MRKFFNKSLMNAKAQPSLYAGMLFSIAFGVANLGISTARLSLFIGLIGIYSIILGITKFTSYESYKTIQTFDSKNAIRGTEARVSKRIAICTGVMSFIIFSFTIVDMFFHEDIMNRGLAYVIFFSTMTFVMSIIAIVNAIRMRKNKSMIIRNLKLVDLAHAFILLALTQRAVMHFVGHDYARLISGLGGVFFSLCGLAVCLIMLNRVRWHTRAGL